MRVRVCFATFFEKKVAPKNFQREVFSAHCAFGVCAVVCDWFSFATFFEKKVAPKNFQREVFSAHSGLAHDIYTIPLTVGAIHESPAEKNKI